MFPFYHKIAAVEFFQSFNAFIIFSYVLVI